MSEVRIYPDSVLAGAPVDSVVAVQVTHAGTIYKSVKLISPELAEVPTEVLGQLFRAYREVAIAVQNAGNPGSINAELTQDALETPIDEIALARRAALGGSGHPTCCPDYPICSH